MSVPAKVLYPFTGDTVGGSHVSAIELIDRLDRNRYLPVIGLHREGVLSNYLNQRGLDYVRLPSVALAGLAGPPARELFAVLRAAISLVWFLRKNEIDIVHTNDMRMHILWGLPTRLSHVHFVWHQRNPTSSRRLALYASMAAEILTISDFCRQGLIDCMRARAKLIYNPFEVKENGYTRAEARQLIYDRVFPLRARYVIGFVSNFLERKRPLFFVEIAACLREILGEDVVFLMIGEARGESGVAVKRRIDELGLNQSCLLLGMQFPVEPWLAGMNVLVAPAVNEGFGRVLVEAMLSGTPVVASNDGGHREIVEHGRTGLLASADETEAFASQILQLISDPVLAEQIANQAFEEAKLRFSAKRHAEEIQAVYDKLCDPRSTAQISGKA